MTAAAFPAIDNLVHELSTSTGTGNLTLTNVNGKKPFNTAFGNGATTSVFLYFISNRDVAGECEWGEGHLSAASTLVRDVVKGGSNGTSAVNFSAGTKDVVCDLLAEYHARLDIQNTWTLSQIIPVRSAFSANKGGTNQTGIADVTTTAVTWPTEAYDIGSNFASNVWTPPAGKVLLVAALYVTGTISITAVNCVVILTKNGSSIAQSRGYSNTTSESGSQCLAMADANGTDTFGVSVYIDVTASTGTVDGTATLSYFQGTWLGK